MSQRKPTITKTELLSDIVGKTNLSKSQINAMFEALVDVVESAVSSGKTVTIPNLVKIYVHKKKATSARQMKNPFTGEMMTVPAKPARKVIKTKPVKNLKEIIS